MTKVLDGHRLDQLEASHARQASQIVSHRSETLLRRAGNLAKEDQMLIELFVRGQLSHRRLAALLGQPHGTISRRLKRLGTLLNDPLIVRLLDGPCPLERTDRQLAIGYFLHRRPLRELAAMHELSVPQISRRLQFVRGWFRGASGRGNSECRMRNAE